MVLLLPPGKGRVIYRIVQLSWKGREENGRSLGFSFSEVRFSAIIGEKATVTARVSSYQKGSSLLVLYHVKIDRFIC